jgi:hypothetical protein
MACDVQEIPNSRLQFQLAEPPEIGKVVSIEAFDRFWGKPNRRARDGPLHLPWIELYTRRLDSGMGIKVPRDPEVVEKLLLGHDACSIAFPNENDRAKNAACLARRCPQTEESRDGEGQEEEASG